MKAPKIWIFAALSAFSCCALAQWQWVDADGRQVFSDRAPPAHIRPQKILKRPIAAADLQPETAAGTTAATQDPRDPAAQVTQDKEDAARKAQEAAQLKAQEAKAKQEAAKLAQQRQANCQQAQAAQTTLQSGRMLAHINEKGEQGFLSDTQRQQQLQRVQAVIQSECGAAPRK
jgi:hypothetical protein